MAEAGNEDTAQLCPCGFWGSPQTMNLCSKCYKEKSNATEAKVGSDLDSTNSTQDPTFLNKLGLLSSTSSPMTGARNSNIIEKKVDNQEAEVKEPEKEAEKETEENLNEVCLLPKDRPVQKNKKKCWVCKLRLELAQRELGLCKCGYTFCFLHRLPEQHECVYDHKEGGRQQALKTMVAAHKKIGRSFHRMDSRPE